MAKCLHKRLTSERGASLSFALFLLLACCAFTSIVLAAATASYGQFAELGKLDQRYYSVTSAAGLFQSELGSNGKVSYSFTATRVGTKDERGDGEVEFGDFEVTKPELALDKGLYFLYRITEPKVDAYIEKLQADAAAAGADPAGGGTPALPADPSPSSFSTITYSFNPNIEVEGVTADDFKVSAEARNYNDWLAEIVLHNGDDAIEAADRFNLFMRFDGTMKDDVTTTEALKETEVEIVVVDGKEVEQVKNIVEVTETHEITVSWELRQLLSGKGFD